MGVLGAQHPTLYIQGWLYIECAVMGSFHKLMKSYPWWHQNLQMPSNIEKPFVRSKYRSLPYPQRAEIGMQRSCSPKLSVTCTWQFHFTLMSSINFHVCYCETMSQGYVTLTPSCVTLVCSHMYSQWSGLMMSPIIELLQYERVSKRSPKLSVTCTWHSSKS